MKKWLGFLLVLTLLASAAFALAEENFVDSATFSARSNDFPHIPFGMDMEQAIEYINSHIGVNGQLITENAERKNVTLSDGTQYLELSAAGETSYGYCIAAKYYFTAERRLAAGILEFILDESLLSETTRSILAGNSLDISKTRDMIISTYGFGEPQKLSLAENAVAAELLGEVAHLEEGQDMWRYTTKVILQGPETYAEVKAVMALRIIGDTAYLAAWPTGSVAQADLPGGLTGLDQLSPEDQQAVKQYGNFLEAQKQEQLQKFIDFLLGKHQ